MKLLHNLIDKLHHKEILRHRHYRSETEASTFHLKLRFVAGICMLVIALLGVILTDFVPSYASHYWFYAVPTFAVINIILSWHAAFAHKDLILVWHELLHWLMLLIMVLVMAIFLNVGTISDVVAGIMMLSFLALTTLLAGVHFDSMLIVIGVILLILDVLSAVFIEFAMFVLVPVIIIVGILIFWRARSHSSRRREEALDQDDEDDSSDDLDDLK